MHSAGAIANIVDTTEGEASDHPTKGVRMSQETMQWLNSMTLIGYTEKRGNAWHYRASEQGAEPNHYDGAVPIEDVRRRLFHWQPLEAQIAANAITDDGVITIHDPSRKAILRPPGAFGTDDKGAILGVFKDGYLSHDYDEWLLKQVAHLLDDDLNIGSAGLLKEGAVAFVSVEVPENITTPEGVVFRPNLLAATSLDGSLSTTYHRVVTNVVCDNTMSAGLAEKSGGDTGYTRIKVKHSRYSKVKLTEARSALALVHTIADDFAREVAELTAVKMDAPAWGRFVDLVAPLAKEGKALEGRSLTMATTKRATLERLWNHDQRVAPWKGTVYGAVQAINTATHHEFTVKGDRGQRNMLRAVTGGVDKLDADTRELAMAAVA